MQSEYIAAMDFHNYYIQCCAMAGRCAKNRVIKAHRCCHGTAMQRSDVHHHMRAK